MSNAPESTVKDSDTKSPTPAGSKAMFWSGWVITILPALALLMSGVGKLMKPAAIVEEFQRLGYQESVIVGIGIVELVCTIIYLIPRTSILGAILLTGYLGGAIATHVRIGDPFIPPIIMGVMIWLGPFLRCRRLRALIPLRT